jgi:hypothetical protein
MNIKPPSLFRKKTLIFGIFIFSILTIGRLLISGNGYLDDPDEYVYHLMLFHLNELKNFEIYYWCKATFRIHFFPVELAIRLFQNIFTELYANLKGLPLDHYRVLIVPGLFNVLVSLSSLFIIYKILKKLEFNHFYSLLGVFIYGSLLTTNIYTRHILPYENSYFFHIISLYVLLHKDITYKRVLLAGFFSALGLASYFGFFMMFFVNSLFILLRCFDKGNLKNIFKNVLYFVPVAIYIFGFDLISRLYYENSFIDYTLGFSKTIYQGSYDEGLLFAFIHMYLVEKWWGLVLLITFLISVFFIVKNRNKNSHLYLLVVSFCVAYFLYGLNAVLFEGMVFYARVFRMYYLPIIIGFIYTVRLLKSKWLNQVIIIIAFVNYIYIIKELNSLAYPRTEIQKHGLIADLDKNINLEYSSELNCALEYKKNDRFVGINESKLPEGEYLMINYCFFYHDGDLSVDYKAIDVQEEEVLSKKKHFMSHPSYTLEYCSKEGRALILKKGLYMYLIKK